MSCPLIYVEKPQMSSPDFPQNTLTVHSFRDDEWGVLWLWNSSPHSPPRPKRQNLLNSSSISLILLCSPEILFPISHRSVLVYTVWPKPALQFPSVKQNVAKLIPSLMGQTTPWHVQKVGMCFHWEQGFYQADELQRCLNVTCSCKLRQRGESRSDRRTLPDPVTTPVTAAQTQTRRGTSSCSESRQWLPSFSLSFVHLLGPLSSIVLTII